MREDKLDVVEALASPPVLNYRTPAVAGVAEAMGEYDGGCVLGRRRHYDTGSPYR